MHVYNSWKSNARGWEKQILIGFSKDRPVLCFWSIWYSYFVSCGYVFNIELRVYLAEMFSQTTFTLMSIFVYYWSFFRHFLTFMLICNAQVLITKLRSANTVETRQYRKASKALLVLIPLLGITYLVVLAGPNEGVGSYIFIVARAVLLSTQVRLFFIMWITVNDEWHNAKYISFVWAVECHFLVAKIELPPLVLIAIFRFGLLVTWSYCRKSFLFY